MTPLVNEDIRARIEREKFRGAHCEKIEAGHEAAGAKRTHERRREDESHPSWQRSRERVHSMIPVLPKHDACFSMPALDVVLNARRGQPSRTALYELELQA